MTSGFKAAIFDMDGTLLESMKYWRYAAIEFLESAGIPVSDEVASGVYRRSARASIDMAYTEAGLDLSSIPADLGERILRIVEPHYTNDVIPKAGSLEYVRTLHERGIKCCVATATQKDVASVALKKAGFSEYIDFVFDTEDAGCGKANTRYFEAVSERLGIPLNDCIMFEDALYSIKTAKQCGLRVVAIEDDSAIEQRDEIKQLSDIYVSDFNELL